MEDHRLHAFDGIILRMVRAKKSEKKYLKFGGLASLLENGYMLRMQGQWSAINIRNNDTNPINISQNLSLTINKIAQVSKKF